LSPRILVVDDEPSLVRGLTYALERDKFEVEVATDGEAAVVAALTHAVDLVILDLMLPKLSGEDACRQIRAKSDVPIIMLTAKDSERDLLAGLALGADDYVTKPFSAAELIGRIGALLRRRELDRASNAQLVRTVGAISVPLHRHAGSPGAASNTSRPTYGWLLPSGLPLVIAAAGATAIAARATTAARVAAIRRQPRSRVLIGPPPGHRGSGPSP